MILRRITKHVENQNWFAVGIDFFIVVVGVFIGLQVANWNEARQERLSETKYLERFADEIELTIANIEDERAFTLGAMTKIEAFTRQLYAEGTSDDALIKGTNGFLSEGAFFANFRPNRTTFDDLVSTGNVGVIKDRDIRTGLVRLHVSYDEAQDVIDSNIVWIQQGEDRIYYEFDAFRYDARTELLFDNATPEMLASEIRDNRDLLRRHAAFHYWLKTRSLELYNEVEPQARAMLDLINADLEKR